LIRRSRIIESNLLMFVPDKAATAREIARIRRPVGRPAIATWERLAHPVGDVPQRRW
jgi:hypothetical protein